MTRTAAARRPGLSLLEVIVALFVMALGMISLLTLFPLGAIQMGQALRNARAAETAMQADTHMRLWWQRDVVERPGNEDPAFAVLDNPGSGLPAFAPPFDGNPSYPVAIDPIGWQARVSLPSRFSFAQSFGGLVPRRTMNWIATSPNPSAFSFRTATMMDDISFNEVGVPDTNASGTLPNIVVRQGRYNWAAVIQRPVNANRYVADLKILVFDGRSPGIAPLDGELILNATGPAARGTSQLVLNVGATPPEYLRAGNWIMDGTLTNTGIRNAFWYRIQTIDKESLATSGQWILDLQTPLLRDVFPPPSGPGAPVATQFYVFKGLFEVYDRPQLAPSDYKKQVP
jgi:hypothetical protein